MSFIYNYQYEHSTPRFECEDGEQLVAVRTAEVTTSKNGSQMVKVGLDVSNSNGIVYFEHFVEGEFFNRKMSQFFDCLMIQPGNFDFKSWIGKKGCAMFGHRQETWTNNQGMQQQTNRAVLQYFIPRTNEQKQGPASPRYQGAAPGMAGNAPQGAAPHQGAAPGNNPWAGVKSVTTDQLDDAGLIF